MIKYRDKNGKVRGIEGDLFVTKDKNGKDVFAGDKVLVRMDEKFIEGTGHAELVPKIIVPLSSHDAEYNPRTWDIELIKDKEEDESGESEIEKAAKKCAKTGSRKDLQEYLKLRRTND